jgi:transcriptional regulator with XRE-family HTH domain
MSMSEMAERMMVNLKTVQRMEKGDPAVGIGIVATALWVLGLHRRLGDLVAPESDSVALQEEIKKTDRQIRFLSERCQQPTFTCIWKKDRSLPEYWKQAALAARRELAFGMADVIFSAKTGWRSIPFSCH